MPSISTLSANDPVSRAVQLFTHSAARVPVPLIATAYDIAIRSGLADVAVSRRFLNSEAGAIEATLTFPLPVHAVLYALEARIGERVLKAVAKPRKAARETYEDAIDRGKTTVLHEELLPGVHMLSVGQVAPGAEIVVTARFAVALAAVDGRVTLRIPTTVGDIYGDSGLSDSDDLAHGGPVIAADVTVDTDGCVPVIAGGTLAGGKARVPLDRPIVVELQGWRPAPLTGRSADGNGVSLSFEQSPGGTAPVSAAVLVDHSGSMNEPCAAAGGLSKHSAVLIGLSEAAGLGEADRLSLWEFQSHPREVGAADGPGWRALVRQLSAPAGGTEIDGAIGAVLANAAPADVLLITDGKSHALDVHALARRGTRFTVVLIGEDSLEANVGHLAALTGGDIVVPLGSDVGPAVTSALRYLRLPRPAPSRGQGAEPVPIVIVRSGLTISAAFGATAVGAADVRFDRAIGAYAARLRLRELSEADAVRLAVAEGLVTHLTSLVLVDEAGATQPGIPATRKVALPSPARAVMAFGGHAPARSHCTMMLSVAAQPCTAPRAEASPTRKLAGPAASPVGAGTGNHRARGAAAEDKRKELVAAAPVRALAGLSRQIDWLTQGQRLADGDLGGLPPATAEAIQQAADFVPVQRVAERLGIPALKLVVGLLARSAAAHDRHAARVARALLGRADPREVQRASHRMGLAA